MRSTGPRGFIFLVQQLIKRRNFPMGKVKECYMKESIRQHKHDKWNTKVVLTGRLNQIKRKKFFHL